VIINFYGFCLDPWSGRRGEAAVHVCDLDGDCVRIVGDLAPGVGEDGPSLAG
jgi:hypothetical protein